jgi:hypothetical protein
MGPIAAFLPDDMVCGAAFETLDAGEDGGFDMLDTHKDKICPILAAFGNKDSVSTGSSWAARCKGDECGWWDADHKRCAVIAISNGLAQIDSANPVVPPA